MMRYSASLSAAVLITAAFALPLQAQSRLSLAERVEQLERQSGSNTALVQTVNQLQQLQQEVQELRGLVEEQNYQIDQLRQQQKNLYLDLDSRLQQSAGPAAGSPATDVRMMPSNTGEGTGQVAVVEDRGQANTAVVDTYSNVAPPEVRQSLPDEAQTVALSSGGVQQEVAALNDPAQENKAYQVAFDDLRAGRYADSARKFDAFVKNYPASEYADNAQYWLGESYYATRNYRIALEAFQDLLNRYPDSNKKPDALLKLGYTLYELEQLDESQKVLQSIITDYPGSSFARLAEMRLRSLKLRLAQ